MYKMIIAALLCAPVCAQTGTLFIPSNDYIVHNLGPGLGSLQIPFADPGKTHLYVEVEFSKDYTLEWEISPYPAGSNNPIWGYFKADQTRIESWQLTAGLAPITPQVRLCYGRMYPNQMTLEHTYPSTIWDGVLDWQGPTCLTTAQTYTAPARSATISLNILGLPPRDLWITQRGHVNSISTISGHGIQNMTSQDPWRARIIYRYLP